MKLIGIRENDAVTSLHAVGQPDSLEDGLEEEVIMGSEKGLLNRIRLADITQQSRTATGVMLMRLNEGDSVKAVSVVLSSQIDDEEGPSDTELEPDGEQAAFAVAH